MKVFNGEGVLLGRLCSQVAKAALLGEEVKVINCDKVVVSGKKQVVFSEEKVKRARRGYPLKSQKRIRLSHRYVRRVIRGMLPWKTTRGREAFARVLCYTGVPEELGNVQAQAIDLGKKMSFGKLPNAKYVTVQELIKHVGGKE